MGRRLLQYQADRIEMVLASHDVRSRVFGGLVTPRFIRFKLLPELGTRVNKVSRLSEEIALALAVPSCRIYRRDGRIEVEVPRDGQARVDLLPLCKRVREIPPCTAVLGLDGEGIPLLLRLPGSDVVHVLIGGVTGSGKTALARAMIASLAFYNQLSRAQMVLIDPKGDGFSPFYGLPHLLYPIIEDVDGAILALSRLVEEMERRGGASARGSARGVVEPTSARLRRAQPSRSDFGELSRTVEPRIVVFMDELADLMMEGGKEMERLLTRLLQRGRGAGIHVVACVQKPTARVIGSLVKSNFPVRMVGSVASPEDAKVVSGIAGTGAERLLGRGDFLLVSKGRVIRFQAAHISEAEIEGLVRRMR